MTVVPHNRLHRSVQVATVVGLLLVLSSGPATAAQDPDTFELVGIVTDHTDALLVAASVQVVGPVRRTSQTDTQGRFRFPDLPRGEYRVVVQQEGYTAREIRVEPGTTPQVYVLLELPATPVAQSAVTASRVAEPTLQTPFLVTRIEREELRETAATTFDEALRTVAGLQHATQGNAFTRISTRGLRDTADTLVLVDGVPFRQLNGSADLTMIPVSALQGIEFVKGTTSSIYGRNAIGGAMQFFTVPPAGPEPSAEISVTGGSFGTAEVMGAIHLPYDQGRFAASGTVSTSDGFQDGAGRDSSFLTLVGDHTFSPRLNVSGHFLVSDVDATRGSIVPLEDGEPMFGITREDNFGIPDARFEGRYYSYTGRVESQVRSNLVVTNTLNFNRYDRVFTGGITIVPPPVVRNKGYFESDSVQDTWINDTLLEWELGSAQVQHTIVAGSTFEWGAQEQPSTSYRNAPLFLGPNYTTPVPGPTAGNDPKGIRSTTTILSDFDQFVASLYLQDRVQIGRVGATAGFRWDYFDQELRRSNTTVVSAFDGNRVSPRVGIDVEVLSREVWDVVAFGSFAEGFRPITPRLSTRNGITIPQLLEPEVTRTVETGVRLRHPRAAVQLAVFNMRKIDGQRSFRSSPDDFFFVNATTRVRGVEAETEMRVGDNHRVFLNYAFHDAKHDEFRPTLTTNFDGFRLRMTPRHIAGAGTTIRIAPIAWTTSVAYVGSRPLRDNVINPQLLPSYTLLNMSLSADLGPGQILVSATNLTDEYYIADDFSSTNAGVPGMPRRFLVKYQYSY